MQSTYQETNQTQKPIEMIPKSRITASGPVHVPKLKFSISGMPCELPTTLSQRRNSALQSLFQTTTSLSSALNSARGNLNSTQSLLELEGNGSTQINLESTAELKAFATVDLAKINKERSNQLKFALEDNLSEKQRELNQVLKSHQQMKEEYDHISKKQAEKSQELDQEMMKQKQYLANLKEQLKELTQTFKNEKEGYEAYNHESEKTLHELESNISETTALIKKKEEELQILSMQKKSLQMSIDMQRNVRISELDMKINPLLEERNKIELHSQMLQENFNMMKEVLSQNQNECQMIQEDLAVSESIKVDLVFQREEFENYIEKMMSSNNDLKFIYDSQQSSQGEVLWEQLLSDLLDGKQRSLLLNLIRELQQYILGMSSGTTDNSIMQSDELEELEFLIERKRISNEDAVENIVEIAERKMKLQLNRETLMEKLEAQKESLDVQNLQEDLQTLQQVQQQMNTLDQKIKVIYNRCQNDLNPRLKALTKSEQQMKNEYEKVCSTLNELQEYMNEIDKEIQTIQITFEQTYNPDDQEFCQTESKLQEITENLQQLEYDIDSLKENLQQSEQKRIDVMNEKQSRTMNYNEIATHLQRDIDQLKDSIKKELQKQSEGVHNQRIDELSSQVTQIKCDKESALKRLKFIEQKLQSAQDSVQHAKQVLDNHNLQAQQEQLNLKVQAPLPQKRLSGQVGSLNNLQIGHSKLTRISSIQQKSNSLSHGEVLSPTREESRLEQKRNLSVQKEKIITPQLSEQERMHSHFIDHNSSQTDMKKEVKRNFTSEQKKRQTNNQISQSNLKKEKSTIDVVRYYYDSASAISSEDSQNANHFNQFMSGKPMNSKSIPIQTLITPRDPLHEIQNNHNFIYESYYQQMSAASNDSMQSSAQKTDRSMQNESILHVQNNSNHLYNRNQRVFLRQNNSSFDGKQLKNVVIPLYAQFKENVTPNSNQSINNSNSSINMRKYSQATNISQISNQSILTQLSRPSGVNNRPPAVPQSMQYLTSGSTQSESQQTPRGGSNQKDRRMTQHLTKLSSHQSSRNTSKDSFATQMTTQSKPVQTKLKLSMNIHNLGRPLQVGIVDLTKCYQSLKDEQFFENIKPLIEGASFLVATESQFILKQFYLDFSLLRVYMVDFNGDKDIIMIENIVKPELPQSTLDQIRQEKSQTGNTSVSNQNKRYEFNLILNNGGNAERLHLLAMSYDELKLWIVGFNSLIANKSNLMRLSCQIMTQN